MRIWRLLVERADQWTQLGRACLDAHRQARFAKRIRCDRSNRCNQRVTEIGTQRVGASQRFRDGEQVVNLRRVGERNGIHFAPRNRIHQLDQRSRVVGHRPAVSRNLEDFGTTRLQRFLQFDVGDAVALNDHACASDSKRCNGFEHLVRRERITRAQIDADISRT